VAEVEKGPLDKVIDSVSGWKASFDRLRAQFGIIAAFLLVLSFAGGLIWWNWEDISKKPGISYVLSWLDQRPIAKIQSDHLTIALTHLEDDVGNSFEKMIEDEVYNGGYADVIPIDMRINIP
jgi:hypothetical protein